MSPHLSNLMHLFVHPRVKILYPVHAKDGRFALWTACADQEPAAFSLEFGTVRQEQIAESQ
jgi:hypothetical protein